MNVFSPNISFLNARQNWTYYDAFSNFVKFKYLQAFSSELRNFKKSTQLHRSCLKFDVLQLPRKGNCHVRQFRKYLTEEKRLSVWGTLIG